MSHNVGQLQVVFIFSYIPTGAFSIKDPTDVITTPTLTRVSHKCCKSVKRVLQDCYKSVNILVQECYKSFTRVSQVCHKSVIPARALSIEHRTNVVTTPTLTQVLHRWYASVTRV
jgi:hypothetical protein